MRFPSKLWRAQRGMHKGPPQPINVILTDMGTKKKGRESPEKASGLGIGVVQTKRTRQGWTA